MAGFVWRILGGGAKRPPPPSVSSPKKSILNRVKNFISNPETVSQVTSEISDVINLNISLHKDVISLKIFLLITLTFILQIQLLYK